MTRLFRPRTDRMIGGVCGGLGLYFGIDPVIVRLLFVVLALTTGVSLVLYPLLWLVMPDEQRLPPLPTEARFDPQTGLPLEQTDPHQTVRLEPLAPEQRNRSLAVILLGVGALILLSNVGELLHINVGDMLLPILLIGAGVFLLRGRRVH